MGGMFARLVVLGLWTLMLHQRRRRLEAEAGLALAVQRVTDAEAQREALATMTARNEALGVRVAQGLLLAVASALRALPPIEAAPATMLRDAADALEESARWAADWRLPVETAAALVQGEVPAAVIAALPVALRRAYPELQPKERGA